MSQRSSKTGLLLPTTPLLGNGVSIEGDVAINPKRPGLFGQLDTRGGAAAAHFRERRLELPNFHFCPQTVFHMKAGIFS